MDKEMFKSGILYSPPDERDFNIAMACRAIGETPKKVFPYEFNKFTPLKVLNQLQTSMCVAFGIASYKSMVEFDQLGKIIDFSTGQFYVDRFGFHRGEGMITRDALTQLMKWGIVPFDDFQYSHGTYDELRPIFYGENGAGQDALRPKAYPYRISSFYRLDVEGEDVAENIKTALVNGMLIATIFDVKESFWEIGKDGIVPIPKANEKNYGGHLTLTRGYKGDYTNTLNSWGEEWGDKGHAHFPLDYPWKEVWAMSDKIDANLVKLQQKFEDANMISDWARGSVAEATELELMNGDGTNFNPQGLPSREQLAIVAVNIRNSVLDEVKKLLEK